MSTRPAPAAGAPQHQPGSGGCPGPPTTAGSPSRVPALAEREQQAPADPVLVDLLRRCSNRSDLLEQLRGAEAILSKDGGEG